MTLPSRYLHQLCFILFYTKIAKSDSWKFRSASISPHLTNILPPARIQKVSGIPPGTQSHTKTLFMGVDFLREFFFRHTVYLLCGFFYTSNPFLPCPADGFALPAGRMIYTIITKE